jgi:hypothetical protein
MLVKGYIITIRQTEQQKIRIGKQRQKIKKLLPRARK